MAGEKDASVTIIIPAYNEDGTIGEIVRSIKRVNQDYELIVVDDGSTDATFKDARESGAKVIRHPYNIGNGAAVKTGIRNAKRDIVMLLDADFQHPPEDIPKILNDIGNYDMVVGARTNKSKVSYFRRFGNRILNIIANYLSGHKIPDLTSGFRAIKREVALKFLHILPNGYSYPTTLTLSLLIDGYAVKFVPLDTVGMRKRGKSKLHPFQEAIRFLIIIIRTIVMFNPLKIFIPVGAFIIMLGTLSMGYDVYKIIIYGQEKYGIEQGTILALILGVLIIFFGFIADQLANIRRELSIWFKQRTFTERKF